MPAVIVVGAQWGDEGKGKIVDLLALKAAHVVRAQGGNNAGHTVIINDQEFKLHLIPSGILSHHTQCYITGGTVIDPQVLLAEIEQIENQGIQVKGRLYVSECAHIIFPYHKLFDTLSEERKGDLKIGTTGRGIGPCYSDKINRIGIRLGDLIRPHVLRNILEKVLKIKNEELTCLFKHPPLDFEEIFTTYAAFGQKLLPFTKAIEGKIDQAIRKGENVLFEAAQGTFLDVTYGTYPYVTSSNTTAGGICSGSGIGPTQIDHTLGVVKAYTTRVGNGPLPTAVSDEELFTSHLEAREFGTTTGRKRRIGWFDAVLVKESIRINGIDSIALTKLDVLDKLDEIKICVGYEINGQKCDFLPSTLEDYDDLKPIYETLPGWKQSLKGCLRFEDFPTHAKHYLDRLQALFSVPISIISVGPERSSTVIMRDLFS